MADDGLVVTRTAPTELAPVDEGAFRTAGRGFIVRRPDDRLVIEARPRRLRHVAIGAVLLAPVIGAWLVGGISLAIPFGFVAAIAGAFFSVWLSMRPRVALTAQQLDARLLPGPIPRAAITGLRLTELESQPQPTWSVEVLDDRGRAFTIAIADPADAATIATLLARELDVPLERRALD